MSSIDKRDPVHAEWIALGLDAWGWQSDPRTTRGRLERIWQLAAEGKGPGAFLERFLAECRETRMTQNRKAVAV